MNNNKSIIGPMNYNKNKLNNNKYKLNCKKLHFLSNNNVT